MNLTGNTIFITGGGSGIGRGLAEALHAKGNQVIISGRRRNVLEEVTKANAGMDSIELDIENPKSIASVAETLIAKYPKLNVVINNAGMMKMEAPGAVIDNALLVSTLTTNVMGPIRVTSALLEHLKKQPTAYVAYTTSGLAFVADGSCVGLFRHEGVPALVHPVAALPAEGHQREGVGDCSAVCADGVDRAVWLPILGRCR
jgi:uncharacterized oxidoreductase